MANLQIQDLPAGASSSRANLVPIQTDSGVTQHVTVDQPGLNTRGESVYIIEKESDFPVAS